MKKNKIKSIGAIILINIILILMLSGCQLAKSNDSALRKNPDVLCGVFVTLRDTSLPMEERKLDDIEFTNENGVMTISEDSMNALFSRKVEGTLSEDKLSIDFNGVEGSYIGLIHSDTGKKEDSVMTTTNGGFHDVKVSVNSSDTTSSYVYEATLYVSTAFNDIVKMNPVYITNEGTYYTDLGQAQGASSSGNAPGQMFTQTLENSSTKTTGKSSITESVKFTIHVKIIDPIEEVLIKEMNEQDELIKTTSLTKASEEEYIVDREARYIIVEEFLAKESSQPSPQRSIYTLPDELTREDYITHTIHFEGENGAIDSKMILFLR